MTSCSSDFLSALVLIFLFQNVNSYKTLCYFTMCCWVQSRDWYETLSNLQKGIVLMQYLSAEALIWNQDLEMFLLTCSALEIVRCENKWYPLYLNSLNLFFYSLQFICPIYQSILYKHFTFSSKVYTGSYCNYFLKPV